MNDGTIFRCATCGRAAYCWWDHSMVPLGMEHEAQYFADVHYTHFRHPHDQHDAVPMRSNVTLWFRCTPPWARRRNWLEGLT